jgi:hypothetical protein
MAALCVDRWADALMMDGLWILDALVNECVDEFVNDPGCRGVDVLYRRLRSVLTASARRFLRVKFAANKAYRSVCYLFISLFDFIS